MSFFSEMTHSAFSFFFFADSVEALAVLDLAREADCAAAGSALTSSCWLLAALLPTLLDRGAALSYARLRETLLFEELA